MHKLARDARCETQLDSVADQQCQIPRQTLTIKAEDIRRNSAARGGEVGRGDQPVDLGVRQSLIAEARQHARHGDRRAADDFAGRTPTGRRQ